jgi:hypothetical protein
VLTSVPQCREEKCPSAYSSITQLCCDEDFSNSILWQAGGTTGGITDCRIIRECHSHLETCLHHDYVASKGQNSACIRLRQTCRPSRHRKGQQLRNSKQAQARSRRQQHNCVATTCRTSTHTAGAQNGVWVVHCRCWCLHTRNGANLAAASQPRFELDGPNGSVMVTRHMNSMARALGAD